MLRPFKHDFPQIGNDCYIDKQAVLIGNVSIGEESSVWPLVTIRGDVNSITIGRRTNIQDNSVLHVTHKSKDNPAGFPITIGDDVTIGHQVLLHGCTIGNKVLIGMGSVIMDGAIIEDEVLLGAGSLVPPAKLLKSGYLYMGSPARQIRKLTVEELGSLQDSATTYVELKNTYLNEKINISSR